MPSIRIQCPQCQAVRSVHDRLMGREIRCPECDFAIQVPTQQEIDAAKEERRRQKAEQAVQRERWQKVAEVQKKPDPKHPSAEAIITHFEVEESLQLKKRAVPKDDMDMTPMVDVTFLLLIFFMITANFTMQKSIQVPAQKSDEASTNAVPDDKEMEESVTVQIDEFNAYTVLFPDGTEREAPSKQDLIVTLADARLEAGDIEDVTKLIVQAHQDCIHATVINALDAGRQKGFTSFQVTVVEEFE